MASCYSFAASACGLKIFKLMLQLLTSAAVYHKSGWNIKRILVFEVSPDECGGGKCDLLP